jgi:hypothetical protein
MTYVSWAALYEGATDEAYFEQLIPRVMEEIIMLRGIRNSTIPPAAAIRLKRRSVEEVAKEACAARDAFHLVFIHADTGGRGLENGLEQRSIRYCEAMHTVCNWPPVRCITVSPRHETEASMLADPQAVTAALGYLGTPASIGLPANSRQAERLDDAKATLTQAMAQVRGRRRHLDIKQIVPAIAQRQSLVQVRNAGSFVVFEAGLLSCTSRPRGHNEDPSTMTIGARLDRQYRFQTLLTRNAVQSLRPGAYLVRSRGPHLYPTSADRAAAHS